MDIKEYKEKDKLGGWSGEPVQDVVAWSYGELLRNEEKRVLLSTGEEST